MIDYTQRLSKAQILNSKYIRNCLVCQKGYNRSLANVPLNEIPAHVDAHARLTLKLPEWRMF